MKKRVFFMALLCFLFVFQCALAAPPTPKNLTYNGDDQQLINAGSAGTYYYRNAGDREWLDDASLFTAKDAGSYDIEFLQWNSAGDPGDSVSADGTVTAVIAPYQVSLNWTGLDPETEGTYDGEPHKPSVTVETPPSSRIADPSEVNTCLLSVTVMDVENTDGPSDAGSYTAEAEMSSCDNFTAAESSLTYVFAIEPRTVALNPDTTPLDYNGKKQIPSVTVDNCVPGDDCVLVFGEGAKDAGSHTVRVTAVTDAEGNTDGNYKLPADSSINFTIDPLKAELVWDETDEFDYDSLGHVRTATVGNLQEDENGNKDECSVTVKVAAGSDQEDSVKDAGDYTAEATALSNSNYVLDDTGELTAEFSILAVDAGVDWSGTEVAYDGNDHAPAAEVTGLKGSDQCTFEVAIDGTELSAKDAGTYEAVAYAFVEEDCQINYNLPEENTADFVITPRVIELSWVEPFVFPYDGDEHGPTAVINNLVPGDDCTITVSGTGKDAGDYSASADELAGENSDNYTLEGSAAAEQAFTVTPRAVKIEWTGNDTETPFEYEYDETPHAPTASVSSDVLVDGDSCEVTEVTVSGRKATDGKAINVGSYTASASKLSNPNYTLEGAENVQQNFKIYGEKGTVLWDQTEFDYDAAPHAPEASIDGNEEINVIVIIRDAGGAQVSSAVNAGTYTAVAVAVDDDNYELPEDEEDRSTSFTIKPAEVTLSWTDTEFTYDGSSHVPTATAEGLKGSDSCTVTVEEAKTDAGTYTAAATALSNANYKLPENVTQEFTIAKAEVTLKWNPDPSVFTYNGEDQAPAATAEGLKGSDSCDVTVSGTGKDAGDYIATATELSNANYKLPENVTQEFTIEPAEVTLSWTDTEFTYDGSSHVPTATAEGLKGSDSCTVTVEEAKTDAGTYTATATALSNANYKLPENTTQEFTIAKAEVTLKWNPDPATFTYNGKEQAPTAAAEGLKGSDICEVTVSGAGKDAGEYTAAATALSNDNYKLPENASLSFMIEPAEVTIAWGSETEFTYDGEPHSPTVTVSGAAEGETVNVTVEGAQTDANLDGEKYTASVTGVSDPNYKLSGTVESIEFTIAKADLVKDTDFTAPTARTGLVYSGSDQLLINPGLWTSGIKGTFMYKQTGYTPKEVDTEGYDTAIPAGKDAGSYEISWLIDGDRNHNDYGPETLTADIAKKPIDASMVKLSPSRVIYNGSEQEINITVANGSETLTEGTDYEVSGDRTGTEEGDYTVTITIPDSNPNYEGSVSVSWTIGTMPPPNSMTMFRIGDPEIPVSSFCAHECLPGTGLPTRVSTPMSVRPDGLNYTDLGMRIQIPRFNVDVELLGVPETDGSWAVEWLGDRAGLLSGTALPGSGYSMVAAHNHLNETEAGPFVFLSYLDTNDVIFVNSADGKLTRFRVFANELVSPTDLETVAAIAGQESQTLVLVTCENESVDGGYLNRRVVFAKPLD